MENDSFKFTYSAKEQEEIKKIRDKYTSSQNTDDKLDRVRKLDRMVARMASTVSLILGVIGTLLLGSGMSCVMVLGDPGDEYFIAGIIIGVVGIAMVVLAYPAYVAVFKHQSKKVAPEILKLTEELMK